MFYDTFISLCEEKGISPSRLLSNLGISKGGLSRWREGTEPTNPIKKKIADYFGITVSELMSGEIKSKKPATKGDELDAEIMKTYNLLSTKNKAAALAVVKSLLETQE